jgi:nitrogen fixation NifU-like protein
MSRQLQDLYPPLILDHSRRPRNRRVPERFSHSALGDNPLCGDCITVYLRLEGEVIGDIAFDGESCALATASASLMTEALRGGDVDRAQRLRRTLQALIDRGGQDPDPELGALAVLAAIGGFASRVQCATLAWQALDAALRKTASPTEDA